MSRLACLLAAAFSALLLMPREGRAWGDEAHRIVALVADRVLAKQDAAAHQKMRQILASDRANELTKTDIASEATWADILREKSPEARSATTEWHYARLDAAQPDLNKDCFGRPPLPQGYPASHGPRNNCIVDKIEQFSRELHDPATSQGERLAALQFLLNLVADLHDPLSMIDRKDTNGHCVAVLPPREKKPVRLSHYWDDLLVGEVLGRDPEKAAERLFAGIAPGDIEKWASRGPEAWAQESYALAKSVVYALPRAAADGKYEFPAGRGESDACGPVDLHQLDAGYRDRAAAALREQLAKAGVRLAFLLREDLH